MTTIALTGGVGTGKSTVIRLFNEILEERVIHFDADASVHELLTRPALIGTLKTVFGESILSSDGQIDRGNLREIVFDDSAQRRKLEAVLHPEVLAAGRQAHSDSRRQPNPPDFFIYEVPLLYEVEFPVERDLDLVVAATRKTQEDRLRQHRGLSDDIITRMIDAQLPIHEKMEPADLVIWNEGPEHETREQVYLAIGFLQSRTT